MPKSDYQSQLNLIHNLSTQAQWVQGYQACKIKCDKCAADLRGLTGSVSCFSPVTAYGDELHLYNKHANNSQTIANVTHLVFLLYLCSRIYKPICDTRPSKTCSSPSCNHNGARKNAQTLWERGKRKESERKTKLKSSSEQPAGYRLPAPIEHSILSSLSGRANVGTAPE